MFWFSPLKIQSGKREITLYDLHVSVANIGKSILVSIPIKNGGTDSPVIGRRLGKVSQLWDSTLILNHTPSISGKANPNTPCHSGPCCYWDYIWHSSNPISLDCFSLQSHPLVFTYGTIFLAPPWQQCCCCQKTFCFCCCCSLSWFGLHGSFNLALEPLCDPYSHHSPLAHHPPLLNLLLPGPTDL